MQVADDWCFGFDSQTCWHFLSNFDTMLWAVIESAANYDVGKQSLVAKIK